METEGLKATEAECAEGRNAPRVSLADLEENISTLAYFIAGDAVTHLFRPEIDKLVLEKNGRGGWQSLGVLTICLLVTCNGFTIIGKNAPASPDNFDAELGRKLAYEDAVRQLWPLMGYALREKLAR